MQFIYRFDSGKSINEKRKESDEILKTKLRIGHALSQKQQAHFTQLHIFFDSSWARKFRHKESEFFRKRFHFSSNVRVSHNETFLCLRGNNEFFFFKKKENVASSNVLDKALSACGNLPHIRFVHVIGRHWEKKVEKYTGRRYLTFLEFIVMSESAVE